jgi:hypothetical protein
MLEVAMKHTDIKPGMILALKPERREAYGTDDTMSAYLVTGFKFKPGYAVPYVQCGSLFFKPSDFSRFVAWDLKTLAMVQQAVR